MNDSLFTKCLTGDAPNADWQELDRRLPSEPALARGWRTAVQLDTDLHRLLSPRPVSSRRRNAALWTAAAAAGIMLSWFALHSGGPAKDAALSQVPAAPPPSPPALTPEPAPPPAISPAAEPPVEEAAGQVVLVDAAGKFVLVRARDGVALAPDQEFECRGSGGGRIKVTPERRASFFAADVVNGRPAVGDTVIPADVPAKPAANEFPRTISRVNTKEKVMALTFEDGPATHTPRLLDVLKQEGVKATFFPVGGNLDRFPEIARRIVAEGHELGNHTQTHPMLGKMDEAGLRAEIEPCQNKIRAITGQNPTLFRPPYGSITAAQKEFIAWEYKSTIVLWSLDPQDWKTRDAARTTAAVLQDAGEGRIVMLHDIHASSVDAVPEIIRRLKAGGWRLTTVSELMKLEAKPGADK